MEVVLLIIGEAGDFLGEGGGGRGVRVRLDNWFICCTMEDDLR